MSDHFQPSFTSQRSRWQDRMKKEAQGEDVAYTGPERRYYHRRQLKDRRESIRFDLSKEDRRKNSGRRRSDLSTNQWV